MPTNEQVFEAAMEAANEAAAETPEIPTPPALQVVEEYEARQMTTDMIYRLKTENPLCLAMIRGGGFSEPFWNIKDPIMRTMEDSTPTPFNDLYPYIMGTSKYWYLILGNPAPPLDGKKSLITDHFKPAMLELIAASPDNPIMRAQIMSRIKVGIPEEVKGFEGVKDWIEANVERLILRNDALKHVDEEDLTPAPMPTPARPAQPGITMSLSASENRSGVCSYSYYATCRAELLVDMDLIRDHCDIEDGDTLESIIRNIANSDEAQESCSNSDWGESDQDYDDYEERSSDNHERIVRNISEFKQELKAFMEQLDPELLQQLIANENA